MTPEQAAALRAPFEPQQIGRKPQPYKKDSPKGTCNDCGGFHGLPAMHLDYVGHAAATDRLLSVDPGWFWDPVATDPTTGMPLLDNYGNLWIRLTVAGVTRYGVGDGNGLKEIIGDAIRNAAMRFGVALDLWAKEDLRSFQQAQGNDEASQADAELMNAQRLVREAWEARGLVWDLNVVSVYFQRWSLNGTTLLDATSVDLLAYRDNLIDLSRPGIPGEEEPALLEGTVLDPWADTTNGVKA